MANSIIYTNSLKGFTSVLWEGQPIIRQYPKVRSHLRQHLGEEFALLFAEPHITDDHLRGVGKASWSSPIVSGQATPLENLLPHEQTEAKYLLQTKLRKIGLYAQELLESGVPDNVHWGELIGKMLQIPDNQHILVEAGKVALVMWGFETEIEKEHTFDFKKEFGLDKPILPTHEEKDKIEAQEETPVPETVGKTETSEHEPKEEIFLPETVGKEEKEQTKLETPLPETAGKEETKEPTPPKENNKRKRKFWWLWLLLAVALVVLVVLGLRNCTLPTEKPKPPLPKESKKIVPIDSSKVVKDPDSVRSIVSDRLNVALMGENKDLAKFATKFKELYPKSSYQIIYYDSLTLRLQLQIPAEEREKIRKDLPEKMKEFKPIVWHESLFQRNYKPTDPGFSDANKYWYHQTVKALEAWDVAKGDSTMVMAIIDDSFDKNHPEFQGKIYKPWNVYSKTPDVNVGKNGFHGTHVAGIAIGAGNNGQGVAGIALNCKFMPIQVGDYNGMMSSTAIIDGVLYAIHNGAKIVNMSLGLALDKRLASLPVAQQEQIAREKFKEEEAFWTQIFKAAYEKNIIFVLAAGNSNLLIGLDPLQRSEYTIKVSATDNGNSKASFSNFGSKSTISAPGVQIYSSLPNNQFGNLDGTSMAAPIVAGGIALLKTVNPALSFDQIVEILQTTGLPAQNNAPIGKIIQLDRALNIAKNKRKENPKVDCPNVQEKIDSMLQVIEKLKKECEVPASKGEK
jgi:subtilisin family serine protease